MSFTMLRVTVVFYLNKVQSPVSFFLSNCPICNVVTHFKAGWFGLWFITLEEDFLKPLLGICFQNQVCSTVDLPLHWCSLWPCRFCWSERWIRPHAAPPSCSCTEEAPPDARFLHRSHLQTSCDVNTHRLYIGIIWP